MSPYLEVEHTADVAVEAWGDDLPGLLRAAAEGLFGVMGCEPEGEAPATARKVAVEADDLESLLVEWLSELLYLSERHGECYEAIEFERADVCCLEARVRGRPLAGRARHIKAITYSYLNVQRTARGLEATLTFDV